MMQVAIAHEVVWITDACPFESARLIHGKTACAITCVPIVPAERSRS
jgi:hypothetical protein